MTLEALHDLIFADAEAKSLADSGRDHEAALRASAIASAVQVEMRESYLSITGKLSLLGLDGAAIARRLITTLEAAAQSDVFMAKIKLRMETDGGVDLGHPATRATLDNLAAAAIENGITAEDATAIKSLADAQPTISADEVSRAWAQYRAEGKVS